MNRWSLSALVLLFSYGLSTWAGIIQKPVTPPPAIVLDMDFGNGIDDAMTLRLFLMAVQHGEITPLAVTLTNPSEWTFPAVRYLMDTLLPGNAIPVGICHEDIGLALEDYTRPLVEKQGRQPGGGEDAVAVLRRVLNAAPDHSARAVCTGFGTNLAALLESEARSGGDASDLSGLDLVRRKVEMLILMAGLSEDPEQRSFNVIHNIGAFRKVAEDWPTPVYLVTPDLGGEVLLDLEHLMSLLPREDPYLELARLFMDRKAFHHDPHSIPSWDQVAFLFAAYPNESLYQAGPNLRFEVTPKGVLKAKREDQADPPRHAIKRSLGVPADRITSILMERYQAPEESTAP